MNQAIEKIGEELRKHQIADESFQNAQQIHNLEMKETNKRQNETMERIEKKLDPIVEIFGNLKWGQKVLVKVGALIGGMIGAGIGIVEFVKILLSFHQK